MKGTNNAVIRDCIKRGLRLDRTTGQIIMPSGQPNRSTQVWKGYRMISLWGLGRRARLTRARVICWLVHGEPPFESAEVDHINRNVSDDKHSNLRWVSVSQNQRNTTSATKAWRRNHFRAIRKHLRGEKVGWSKLTEAQVKTIRASTDRSWGWQIRLATHYGVNQTAISKIILRKSWRHVLAARG